MLQHVEEASSRKNRSFATLHGGVLLQGLQWAAAPRSTSLPLLPAGTQVATLPEGISIDPQDQLYLGDTPLVRARTPNGRPWQPLDGFNLTAAVDEGCGTMPGVPRVFTSCTPPTRIHPLCVWVAYGRVVLLCHCTLQHGAALGAPSESEHHPGAWRLRRETVQQLYPADLPEWTVELYARYSVSSQ